jgi:hypothetical protein
MDNCNYELIEKKVTMGIVEIKNFNFKKPDELLCILTEEILSPVQKRMFDYFLWNAKQKILRENIKTIDNFLKVDVPLDELYTIIGFSKNKNKKISYIFKRLKKMKKIDILKINLVKEAKDYTPVKSINFIDDLNDEDIDEITFSSLIGSFKISQTKRSIRIYISPTIAEYLIHSNSYTQLNFLVYSFLRSSYSINLYNYLLNKFQSQKALMDKGIITKKDEIVTEKIKIERLMDILEVPPEHIGRKKIKYFNSKILNPAIKELNNKDVVEFEIKEVIKEKVGKKIDKIAFVLREKKDVKIPLIEKENNQIIALNYKTFLSINQENNNEEIINTKEKENNKSVKKEDTTKNILHSIKEKIKNKKLKFFEFVKELQKLQNIEITNALPNNKGKILRINQFSMLELDGEELDNTKANAIRRILFTNSDLIGKFIEVDEELEKLREKFVNKVIEFKFDGMYYDVGVDDIERIDNDTFKITGKELLREIENFTMNSKKEFFDKLIVKDKLSISDKDKNIKYNNQKELEKLENIFNENLDKFEKWLNELETKSFKISNEFIKINEDSEEYKKLAKELDAIDRLMMKANEIIEKKKNNDFKNNVSNLDKKFVLKKFNDWLKNK